MTRYTGNHCPVCEQAFTDTDDIVTTQLYAKITTQKIDHDLTMFGDKLNQSFGNTTMARGMPLSKCA